MNRIILGTVQFGMPYGINNLKGKISEHEVFKILDFAFKNNIKTIDTASGYGSSEDIIGKYFLKYPENSFKVITKLNLKKSNFQTSLKESLNRLKIKKIDILLFHSLKDYKKHKLKINFKFYKKYYNKLGVSVYENNEINELKNDKNIQIIQAPFNLLDNENKRGELYRELLNKGIELHTRSVFLQGLFFKPLKSFPNKLDGLIGDIEKLNSICITNKFSMSELAIKYVLSKKYINQLIIGVDSLQHLKENFKNLNNRAIDLNLIKEIDSILIKDSSLLNPVNW